MRAERLRRADLPGARLDGLVLVTDVTDGDGRVALERGTPLRDGAHAALLEALAWDELHGIRMEPGDLGEQEAGTRLARVAAGDGAEAGVPAGGHWPVSATRRGVVSVRADALAAVNALDGLAVYTLPDGQVVDTGEVIARAKVLPFVIAGTVVRAGESAAAGGLVAVRPFLPRRVAVVVQESLGSSALDRFRRAFEEKVAWLGGRLDGVQRVAAGADAIAGALRDALSSGADLVVLAGTRAMDPLDPAFDALAQLGGSVERLGVPAHPGSLLWMARVGATPVVGMPSCGLFSRATVLDVFLARFMAGLAVDAGWVAQLGHGGLLTREMAWRFPPYRPRQARGEVE